MTLTELAHMFNTHIKQGKTLDGDVHVSLINADVAIGSCVYRDCVGFGKTQRAAMKALAESMRGKRVRFMVYPRGYVLADESRTAVFVDIPETLTGK